jgi:hypothetical protein
MRCPSKGPNLTGTLPVLARRATRGCRLATCTFRWSSISDDRCALTPRRAGGPHGESRAVQLSSSDRDRVIPAHKEQHKVNKTINIRRVSSCKVTSHAPDNTTPSSSSSDEGGVNVKLSLSKSSSILDEKPVEGLPFSVVEADDSCEANHGRCLVMRPP